MILAHDPPKYNSNPIRIAIGPDSVEVVDLRLVDQYHLRAVATVRIGHIVIPNVRVLHRRGRYGRMCVQMPQHYHGPGLWTPAVELGTPALKAAINDAVLEAWKMATAFRGAADV